jgi:branched-chain amino acid transport system substrate-binding protein
MRIPFYGRVTVTSDVQARRAETAAGDAPRPSRRGFLKGLAASSALAATAAPVAARADGAPIKIGVSAPLTAQFAQLGQWMKNGITTAAQQVNARGGVKGHPIHLVFADDQGVNPTAAANAVTKLLAEDSVVALIGPHFTPAILPSLPMLEQFQVPCLTGASGPKVTAQNNKWVFRVRLNDALGAALLVNFVTQNLGWKKIGLDYVDTAFGQSGAAALKRALAAQKMEPALVRTHSDSTRDFTSHVLAFNDAGIDGLIAWTDDQPAGLLAKQIRVIGGKFGVAGSTSFSQPFFLQLAGSAAEGDYSVTDFTPDNPDPIIQTWDKYYKGLFGKPPELYASTYFDALNLIADAAAMAPSLDGPGLRTGLTKIHGVRGVMTTYSFSPNGDMVHSGLITKVQSGQPMIVKTISA